MVISKILISINVTFYQIKKIGPLSKGSPSVTEFKQKCDICGDSIIEIAMKCLNCSTFLCTKCDQAHDVSHLLLKLTFEPKMKVPTFAVLGNTGSFFQDFLILIFLKK